MTVNLMTEEPCAVKARKHGSGVAVGWVTILLTITYESARY